MDRKSKLAQLEIIKNQKSIRQIPWEAKKKQDEESAEDEEDEEEEEQDDDDDDDEEVAEDRKIDVEERETRQKETRSYIYSFIPS